MEQSQLSLLQKTLDDIRHENGTEYWCARELFPILGYASYDGFEGVIGRAKDACRNAGGDPKVHFRDVSKMAVIGQNVTRDIGDIKLTRYGCYLVALNGDPKKPEVAFAQAYFVTKTRQLEVLQQRMEELERLDAREKLKITEKEFQDMAWARGVDGQGIAHIRAEGDKALFGGLSSFDMKMRLGVADQKKPLADVLPTVTLKAKDLAVAMTNENTRKQNLHGKSPILTEHTKNNKSVRTALTSASIVPEQLPAAEDIKEIEKRHRGERRLMEAKQKKELAEASGNR